MAKKHVSESRGVELLDIVFDVVTAQVRETEDLVDVTTGETVVGDDGQPVKRYTASPALLTLAVKLLKDNSITTQPDAEAAKLSELERELAARQRRSQMSAVSPIRPEAANDE